jgi:FMN reductase
MDALADGKRATQTAFDPEHRSNPLRRSPMSLIVTIVGSPSADSRTLALTRTVGADLSSRGFDVQFINVRDLPAEDLLWGRVESPALRSAFDLLERARGVVVATPIYKAAYTGVLKSFLDVLPQFGLRGKIVLPLATGGTIAHVLALDYALRPVLSSLGAAHVVGGLFILDKLLQRRPDGGVDVDPEISGRLNGIVADFVSSLRGHATVL